MEEIINGDKIMPTENKPPYIKVLEALKKNDPKFAASLAHTIKDADGEILDKKTKILVKFAIWTAPN